MIELFSWNQEAKFFAWLRFQSIYLLGGGAGLNPPLEKKNMAVDYIYFLPIAFENQADFHLHEALPSP